MATFADRKPDVLLALGNRADLDNAAPSRLDRWFRDAYINIGMKYSFAEMEVSNNIQAAQNVDYIDYPSDARMIKALTFYDPQSGAAIPVDIKDIVYVRRYSGVNVPGVNATIPNFAGPPSIGAPFGMQIVLRPVPLLNYPGIIDYWQKPQINATIADTEILLPDDWLEILDYMVELRGFHSLVQNDKAQEIQQLLFGYRTDQGRMVPGLLAEAETRRQQQSKGMDYGIQPRMGQGYTK